MRTLPAQLLAALRFFVAMSLVLGLGYPLLLVFAALTMPGNAHGSQIERDGTSVGSSLIGQSFTDAKGQPLTRYFQSRPSAAGDGYDPTSTGASNLGPEDVTDVPGTDGRKSLLTQVCERSRAIGQQDGVDGARPGCAPDGTAKPGAEPDATRAVPPDAVTASGSGLDPHISPEYALLQAPRVATARSLPVDQVRVLVEEQVQGRVLGFLGEPRVNVLELNLALDGR